MLSRMKASEAGGPTRNQWLLSMGAAIVGGLLTVLVGVTLSFNAVLAGLVAIVVAATCLFAAWLLRSWWGAVATVVAYVVVAAIAWGLTIVGAGDTQAWLVTFPLYIVLPAAVMAVVGLVIGLYGDRQQEQRPRYTRPVP